jgi:hypothetical protein
VHPGRRRHGRPGTAHRGRHRGPHGAPGLRPEDIEIEFTGEFPTYDRFPDETRATFEESRQSVEAALAGDNEKTVEFSADCNSDAVIEPDSAISLTSGPPPATGG